MEKKTTTEKMDFIIQKASLQAKKEVFDDKGCHVEGAIAKALEEYGVKKSSYDMAFFIMKRLREEFNSSNTDSKNEGNSLPYDGEGYSEGQIDCEMERKKEGENGD